MTSHSPPDTARVLHVDDDPAVLEITAEFLKRTLDGATVLSVTGVDQAWDVLETEPVDCIISDYDMPEATGLEFLEEVRDTNPALPFVLYTGKGSEEIASQAINAGVTGYLQKGGADQHRRLAHRVDHAVTEYRAQRESRRYSTVLKALGYPIYVVDERGQFTYVNDAFVDLVGYDRGTLLETEPDLIKTEDSVERINDALRRIVSASGPDMERLEVEIKAKDGTLIPCKDHIAALPFDEEFQGCAGILRDISDDRRRERALQRKNDRLQELISVISHDLRTPLMTARSAAELARATGETEQFETLDQSHARMEQMLDELLTLAQEGERATALDATPIEAVARRAWDTVDPAAATLDVESDLIVEADPGRLQRLFENLFTNAVRHAGAEVVVTVGDLSGPGAGFYVADDGPGIDSEYSETVLEPGFTTATDGTGFGLSIVNRIADAHDWELAVAESATGGARFEFSDVTPVDPDHTTQPELLG